MRRSDKEIKNKTLIDQVLSESEICRIGLLDGDRAYIVPMNYGYRDGVIYFHSAPSGKKIELIKANNRVCFEIEHHYSVIKGEVACDWTSRFRSLMGTGTIEILTGNDDKKEALDIIMRQHGRNGSNIYKEQLLNRMVALRLKIDEISGKESGY